MLLTILTANASTHRGLLHPKRASTCSGTSQKCSGNGLPDNFCCPSSSTCISLNSGSSVICCPEGQACAYIQPITCDVAKQNASLHPNNVIKTTRLDDDLPTCGNACCPFGYSCHGSFCAMDDTASSSTSVTSTRSTTTSASVATSESSTESSTKSLSEATPEPTESSMASLTESSTQSALESSTTAGATTGSTLTIADDLSAVTEESNPSTAVPSPTLSQYSTASGNNLSAAQADSSCPGFPTNAVLAGFFPGAVFGAVAALLVTICIRRQRRNNLPPGEKVAQNTFRKSTGTLIGISDPIPSDESSFRTDFLLGRNSKRSSDDSRSVLSRSRSRVKSLFSASPKAQHAPAVPDDDIPAMPPVPTILSLPVTPPRQRQPSRQPSTESIRVYTPPGVFTNTPTLNSSPYPAEQRPNTTLTEILDQAQAQMRAESVSASGVNSSANSTVGDNIAQRFLLPPPQKLGRRKQLPY
ncbi:hypothetical protein BDW74DRAFT_183146 [Aspergillus multicolor]|uniref:uncharacterized protein n=1 Tax=Aspergillus multicolor TaxID=41759 RepID=UPI003CCCD53D